ncbi:MAG: hypothetical protein ACTS4Z_01250 [Candidatus Hodgkinia cicadicola]
MEDWTLINGEFELETEGPWRFEINLYILLIKLEDCRGKLNASLFPFNFKPKETTLLKFLEDRDENFANGFKLSSNGIWDKCKVLT